MLYREIIVVYCRILTDVINILWSQNAEHFNMTARLQEVVKTHSCICELSV
jgi:hypothetical protein